MKSDFALAVFLFINRCSWFW